MTKIDLNRCKPGDPVRLRNGDIAQYHGYDNTVQQGYNHSIGGEFYISNGRYLKSVRKHLLDVVKILPRKANATAAQTASAERHLDSPVKASQAARKPKLPRDVMRVLKAAIKHFDRPTDELAYTCLSEAVSAHQVMEMKRRKAKK